MKNVMLIKIMVAFMTITSLAEARVLEVEGSTIVQPYSTAEGVASRPVVILSRNSYPNQPDASWEQSTYSFRHQSTLVGGRAINANIAFMDNSNRRSGPDTLDASPYRQGRNSLYNLGENLCTSIDSIIIDDEGAASVILNGSHTAESKLRFPESESNVEEGHCYLYKGRDPVYSNEPVLAIFYVIGHKPGTYVALDQIQTFQGLIR